MTQQRGSYVGPIPPERTRLKDRTAEELTAGAQARAERAKQRAAKRVSANDVLEQRAARTRPDWGPRVRVGIGVSLVGAGLLTAYLVQTSMDTFRVDWSNNEMIISELQSQVSSLDTQRGDAVTAEAGHEVAQEQADAAVSAALDMAREKAELVASLQNQFDDFLTGDGAESVDGAPSQGFMDSVEHRKVLAPLFDDALLIVDPGLIYTGTSIFDIDNDQIDPRLAWHVAQTPCTWSVAAVNTVGSDFGRSDVIWICQGDDAHVGAWANGLWDSDREVFTTLSVGSVEPAIATQTRSQEDVGLSND